MKSLKFNEIISLWLKEKEDSAKTSTIERYSDLSKKLMAEFQNCKISVISNKMLVSYIKRFADSFSLSTVLIMQTVIREIIQYSLNQSYLKSNIRCVFPKHNKKKNIIQCLSSYDSLVINEQLQASTHIADLGILIALNMGLRIGEICALKWNDINFERKSLTVNGTVHRKRLTQNSRKKTEVVITKPKTISSIRELPIPDFILKILRKYKENNLGVFVLSGSCGKSLDVRSLQRRFKIVCSNLIGYTVKFHALRHTYTSLLLSKGVDVKTVSEMLGHSSVSITLNTYRYVRFEDKVKSMKVLEDFIGPKS